MEPKRLAMFLADLAVHALMTSIGSHAAENMSLSGLSTDTDSWVQGITCSSSEPDQTLEMDRQECAVGASIKTLIEHNEAVTTSP